MVRARRDLRQPLASLLGLSPSQLTPGRMTYHLRRLRRHGIIERLPGTHRYRLTTVGLRTALFFTRTYARILRPGIAQILPHIPATDSSLRRCFHQLEQEINSCVDNANVAA